MTEKPPKIEKKENDKEIISFEDRYKKEILPLLGALCPDDELLEEYEKKIRLDLEESVKKVQVAQGNLIEYDEDKTFEEMKGVLISRIKSILEDERKKINKNDKKRLDPELVKRSEMALLMANDFTDLKKYTSRNILEMNIRDFRDYIVGYGKGNYFTEADIDILMNTQFKNNLTGSDLSYYIDKDNGVCESIPKSLMIGLAQSKVDSRIYPIGYGLKAAEKGKYDNETLEHLIASGYGRECFKYFDKFQGESLEKILKSGNLDDNDVIIGLINLNLSKIEFEKYVDIFIKNNGDLYDIKRAGGLFNDKNHEVVRLSCVDKLEQITEIEYDANSNKIDEKTKLNIIKAIISEGSISLLLSGYESKKYLEIYIKNNYKDFRDTVFKYNQEHLVINYLEYHDCATYIEKLIKNGDEYKIVKNKKLLPEYLLDSKIFYALKNKNFVADLKDDLSNFKDLPESEILELVEQGKTDVFLDNIKSFNVSNEFLHNPIVQEACLKEFKDNLNGLLSYGNARVIYDKIPFPKNVSDKAILDAIKTKWISNDRNDWARSIIYQFPHIKEFFKNPDDQNRAFEDLKKELESGYTQNVASILECFPIPEELLKTNEIIELTAKSIQKEFRSAGNYGNDPFKGLNDDFIVNERINKFIKLPDFIFEIKTVVQEIEKLQTEPFYINKELAQKIVLSEKPRELYSHILGLLNEAKEVISSNRGIVLSYINKFSEGGTKEEKNSFFEKISKDIDSVAQNKVADFYENKDYYEFILKEVYPQRNYNTYNHIEEYKDRSEDLSLYDFDRNGYKIRLSGVVGYKIKNNYEKDGELLKKYQDRIKDIEKLATTKENLVNFIDTNFPDTKSKTLEGKIIEYVRENRLDPKSIDLLLAYQLNGNYDQFIAGSNDRTNMYEKMEGKEYVMLSELSERYGDLMKETLKEIGKKVGTSEDAKLFAKDISKEIIKGEKLFIKIQNELSRLPEDKLTTEIIKKKVAKSFMNTFQQIPLIKTVSNDFAVVFSKDNFSSFETLFKERIKEIFQEVDTEVAIDIQKLESLRQSTYEEIKSELDKYEEIKEVDENRKGEVKMSKERIIKGYFSKNRENAHARMIGDVCIASNPKMLENKNYFEFVLFDEFRKKCVGTVMLLKMEEPDGKKYLLYCPNPSVDLVSQVSAEKLYKLITTEIISFSDKNNFDGVLLDKRHGHATNRSGLFQTTLEKSVFHDKKGGEIVFNLKNKHELSNGYIYQDNLNTVWLKEKIL